MEFILANIGNNKVNTILNTNIFEETNKYIEEDNLFNNIENIIEIYKNNNSNKQFNNNKKPIKDQKIFKDQQVLQNEYHAHVLPPKNPQNPQNPQVPNEFDSLLISIIEYIDQGISLLNMDSKLQKLNEFKILIVKNLTLIKMKKTTKSLIETLDNNDFDICYYISDMLKKTIIVDKYKIYGNYDNYLCFNKNNNVYIFDNSLITKEEVYNRHIHNYINNNILKKLNSLLLNDIKTIAENLNIPLFKVEENKNKLLLKNELKNIIKTKLEEYKQ